MKKNRIHRIIVGLVTGSLIVCLFWIFSNRTTEIFPFGSELMTLIYDIAICIIAAGIFYFSQIYIPEKRKLYIIKTNFKKYWGQTKKNVIIILLESLGGGSINTPGIVERLCQPTEFSKYFNEPHNTEQGQTKWDGVLNGMNDMVLGDIAIEFELLIKEIDFVLSKIEMDNEEIIVFLKRLQTVLFHNRNIKLDYGEEKALSRFLWDILGGWDSSTGYRNYDIVERYIDDI